MQLSPRACPDAWKHNGPFSTTPPCFSSSCSRFSSLHLKPALCPQLSRRAKVPGDALNSTASLHLHSHVLGTDGAGQCLTLTLQHRSAYIVRASERMGLGGIYSIDPPIQSGPWNGCSWECLTLILQHHSTSTAKVLEWMEQGVPRSNIAASLRPQSRPRHGWSWEAPTASLRLHNQGRGTDGAGRYQWLTISAASRPFSRKCYCRAGRQRCGGQTISALLV